MFHEINQRVVLVTVALVLTGSARLTWGADNSSTITGVVKTTAGEAAVGALVRVKHVERGISFTVVSLEQGRYRVGKLPAGEYTIQAKGGGFQGDSRGTVRVRDGETTTANLDLSLRQTLSDAMSSADYAKLMPTREAKDVEATHLIAIYCQPCHSDSLKTPLSGRKSRDGWRETIEKTNVPGDEWGLTAERVTKVVDYLAKYFGPERPPFDPDRDLPKTWITGEASKFMITEYELPRGAKIHDVVVDSKGIGWVGEDGRGVIVRVDPQTHTNTRIPVPLPPGESKSGTLHAMTVDSQDRIWFTDQHNGTIFLYNPSSQQFTKYAMPKDSKGRIPTANQIRIHPNGTVWITAKNGIMRLEVSTGKFTEYLAPSGVREKVDTGPVGLAIDGNGVVWFAQQSFTNKVGRVDPRGGEVTEYAVPAPGDLLRRMDADADGNVWLASWLGNVVKIDHSTRKMTAYPTPTQAAGIFSVGVDRKQNLIWVSQWLGNRLARLDPRTNRFVEYPLYDRDTLIRNIAVDPSRPSRVWFGGWNIDTVGYLDVIE